MPFALVEGKGHCLDGGPSARPISAVPGQLLLTLSRAKDPCTHLSPKVKTMPEGVRVSLCVLLINLLTTYGVCTIVQACFVCIRGKMISQWDTLPHLIQVVFP